MFSFTSNIIPNNIFVIGAGGTGSRLMPMLTQFIRSITRGKSPQGWLENPTIWLVDDDTVEQKNLLRQNFIASDIGKPKASVVAERYSRAYEVNVIPLLRRITSDSAGDTYQSIVEILRINSPSTHSDVNTVKQMISNSMVIICVDSTEARRDILNVFIPAMGSRAHTSNRTFFVDAGNEDSFGQVSFFTPDVMVEKRFYDTQRDDLKVPKMVPVVVPVDYIPMDVNYYIHLTDTESTASCADLNQTLAINALMATGIMGIVQNFYYRKAMNYNCVRISLDGGNSTDYNTFSSYLRKDLSTSTRHSVEKTGSKKSLNFINVLTRHSLPEVGLSIVKVIDDIKKKEVALEIARQSALLLEESKLRLAAHKSEVLARRNALIKEKLEEALVASTTATGLVEIVGVVANSESGGITPPPVLTAVPRVRTMVELVPPSPTTPFEEPTRENPEEEEEDFYEEEY